MTVIISDLEDQNPLSVTVFVDDTDKSVYVRFEGFDSLVDADEYADYLTDVLPLLLFESKVKH